jgi:anti-sigma-K factor RskA
MSEPGDIGEDGEALAAEYALGLLGASERAEAEARIARDPAFRAAVAAWHERLAGLAGEAPPVAPPARLRAEIEARLFPAPRRAWFAWIGGGLVAAGLALVALWIALPAPPDLVARLAAEGEVLAFEAEWDAGANELVLVRVAGSAPPAGSDHELWAIGADGVPVSLGLLDGAQLVAAFPQGAPPMAVGLTLAVSLEPEGGSPTGAPTGPVLALGTVTEG